MGIRTSVIAVTTTPYAIAHALELNLAATFQHEETHFDDISEFEALCFFWQRLIMCGDTPFRTTIPASPLTSHLVSMDERKQSRRFDQLIESSSQNKLVRSESCGAIRDQKAWNGTPVVVIEYYRGC